MRYNEDMNSTPSQPTGSHVHITTAIPYVNGKPHLGHVLEWFQADVLARYYRLLGHEVSFTSGSDENSLKNVQAAEKAGVTPQAWLDEYSELFESAYHQLGISLTGFRRGSDQQHHWPGVQQLWQQCQANGDIYQKTYQGLYCVGCEAFYTPAELVDGKCPEHLTEPELISEKNYFFKLSKYQDQLRQLISSGELQIVSTQYQNEMLGFIDQGLEDFSISRSVDRARGFGVPVPGDETQIMYVWFDALMIYMTALGFGYDQASWDSVWNQAEKIIHVIGKGINRFHSIYWIGMLLSAGVRLPSTISVHGYVTAEGQKMSKSLGNVIEPMELVERLGLEPVRYYLLKEIPSHSDGDFSWRRFNELYTADLANGLGNLCSRVAKLAEKNQLSLTQEQVAAAQQLDFSPAMQQCEISVELSRIMQWVADEDKYLAEQQPWTKTGPEAETILHHSLQVVLKVATHLQPFLPQTAEKILSHFALGPISAISPLFPRLTLQ